MAAMGKGVKKNNLKQSAQPGMAQWSQPAQFPLQQQGFSDAAPMQGGQGEEQHMMQLLSKLIHMNNGGQMQGGQQGAVAMKQKQKDVQGDQSKELLHAFVRAATGKHPTRSEILYSTTEIPGAQPPQFISHVVLLMLDPSRTFTGEAMPNQADAERSAARAALRDNGQQVPTNPLGLSGARSGGKGGGGKGGRVAGTVTADGEFKEGVGKTRKKTRPSKCNASCKWCQIGGCWKSGQVPPPEGFQFPGSVLM
eukprot:TRINITY_DN12038_c0_g1_i1.p1 TRINITY_DN12038_c0_g1~~TRINITY_DN12038_c0_g1_i1.p1  ORF type:complete len:252 (-),score=49.88 TRINITY_DN12038_c0_g1_i1:114-869(-)